MTSSGRTTRPKRPTTATGGLYGTQRVTVCRRPEPYPPSPATRHGSSGWGEAPLGIDTNIRNLIETEEAWWLPEEPPSGRLPWEVKDPSLLAGVRGVNMNGLVELLRRYANRSNLLVDLSQAVDRLQGSRHPATDEDQPHELSSACQDPRQRLLSTRFTYDD